jgi:UDP-N-acetylmuramoylalanine--D-glutamate ligase
MITDKRVPTMRQKGVTMQLKGKKVLVFGAGKSGVSAVKLLQRQDADILLYDSNPNLTKKD